MNKSIYLLSGSDFTPIEHVPKKYAINEDGLRIIIEEYFESKECEVTEIRFDWSTNRVSVDYRESYSDELEEEGFLIAKFDPLPKK